MKAVWYPMEFSKIDGACGKPDYANDGAPIQVAHETSTNNAHRNARRMNSCSLP